MPFPRYTLTALPNIPGFPYSYATAINNHPRIQVTGFAYGWNDVPDADESSGQHPVAWLYDAMFPLNDIRAYPSPYGLAILGSKALGLNSVAPHSTVVGWLSLAASAGPLPANIPLPFRWTRALSRSRAFLSVLKVVMMWLSSAMRASYSAQVRESVVMGVTPFGCGFGLVEGHSW